MAMTGSGDIEKESPGKSKDTSTMKTKHYYVMNRGKKEMEIYDAQ